MNDRMVILSYVLATMAGVCFAGGIAILTNGRVKEHGQTRIDCGHVRRDIRYTA